MSEFRLRLTYIGGPTALIELGGLRLLTDPTFDPPSEYPTPVYVLRKTLGPALTPEAIGAIDLVLLSHDHHFDNLDHAGRRLLGSAGQVLTTEAGVGRLGGNTVGLAPWQSLEVADREGRTLRITATPARHGPPNGDRGPVIGFMLAFTDRPERGGYISGDTVWYEGIAEIGRRFAPEVALLFTGAARVPEVGPAHLTLTANEAVRVAEILPQALIIPLHYEGWAHFSEGRPEIARAFEVAGLTHRLRWPIPGETVELAAADSQSVRR